MAAMTRDVLGGASGRACVAMAMMTQRQRQVVASGTRQACPFAHSTLPSLHSVAFTLGGSF